MEFTEGSTRSSHTKTASSSILSTQITDTNKPKQKNPQETIHPHDKTIPGLFSNSHKQVENDLVLNNLNKKLEKYPGNVPNRLERAKIYIKVKDYLRAYEDYKYVYDSYPKNDEAAKGVEMCKQHLPNLKK